jgi:hypothetical protein
MAGCTLRPERLAQFIGQLVIGVLVTGAAAAESQDMQVHTPINRRRELRVAA